jgi:tight adherence protein C
MDYNILIAICAFVTVMSLILLGYLFSGNRGRTADARLQSLNDSSSQARTPTRRGQRRGKDRDPNREAADELTERVVQAGLYKRGAIAIYSTIRFVLMVLPVVMGIVIGQLGLVSPTLGLVYGLIAGVFGTIVPSFWLDYRKSTRQTQIRRALPDALDIIVTCVDAGLSLPAAITRVSKELRFAHPMLAVEMAICQREIQLGASTGTALRRFSQRFDLEELRSLASVIQQAEKFGASITNALRVHAEGLRDKRFQLAEEKAQKAAVKIVFPTILCIFPALFIVLAGPAVTRIFVMFDAMAQQ